MRLGHILKHTVVLAPLPFYEGVILLYYTVEIALIFKSLIGLSGPQNLYVFTTVDIFGYYGKIFILLDRLLGHATDSFYCSATVALR